LNVLAGERYKMVTKESKGLMAGEYGKLPMEPNAEVRKKVIGDMPVIEHRPADAIAPEWEKFCAECAKYSTVEEDVMTMAMFPQLAEKFFEARAEGRSIKETPKKKITIVEGEKGMRKYAVNVNGTMYEVEVEEVAANATVKTTSAPVAAPAPAAAPAPVAAPAPAAPVAAAPAGGMKVEAPMPGTILALSVAEGATVNEGDPICVLEAMKMENDIAAPCSGVVHYAVAKGAAVETGTVLATIS